MPQGIPISAITALIGAAIAIGALIFKAGSWHAETKHPNSDCVGRHEFAQLNLKLDQLHVEFLKELTLMKVEMTRVEGRIATIASQLSSIKGDFNEFIGNDGKTR